MRVAVIGAGASGCMAALAASAMGSEVLLFDSNSKIGRKIYATGNGRCNLTNLRQDPDCYFSSAPSQRVWQILNRFSSKQIMHFFESRGILLHDRGGYVYPRTDQAGTVAAFFERELAAAHVQIHLRTRATAVTKDRRGVFQIKTDRGAFYADRVILSCGGLAGKQYGSSGDGCRFALRFGHSVLDPLPALTSLHVRESFVRRAAGVRCPARIDLEIEGNVVRTERGELQITKDGLSGIAIFQLSRTAAAALSQGQRAGVKIDFLPELFGQNDRWAAEKRRRLAVSEDVTAADWMLGLANRGVIDMLLAGHGIASEKKAFRLGKSVLASLMDELRAYYLHIDGTGGFDRAQTTAGGVPLGELTDDMESVFTPGLYITGETADVDGLCGGYNLTWAFSTGHTAGMAASGANTR